MNLAAPVREIVPSEVHMSEPHPSHVILSEHELLEVLHVHVGEKTHRRVLAEVAVVAQTVAHVDHVLAAHAVRPRRLQTVRGPDLIAKHEIRLGEARSMEVTVDIDGDAQ